MQDVFMRAEDLTLKSNFRKGEVEVNQTMAIHDEVEDTVVDIRQIRHIGHGSTRRSVTSAMSLLEPQLALEINIYARCKSVEVRISVHTFENSVCQGKTLSANPRAMYRFRSACTC